jgi:HD-like signal output (HDOD) protein
MASLHTRGTDAWVERISNKEMPALCSTVRMLEQMAKDDTSSLAHLGQSVLHDHGLTTRILRVANSVTYSRSGNQVTTMSRAAVLLGFNALKHICITATLVDSLLKNRDISHSVYDRLLRLMAQSFHAGMLSKMLLADHDDETREEAFIAALLHNLGESAFWSMGGPLAEELDDKLRLNPDSEDETVREMLGTSFNKLSIGLASSWNMGKLLIASLTDPDRRTPEVQAINLANRFSALMMNPHTTQAQLQQGLKELGKVMELDVVQVKQKVKRCNYDSVRLATTYGARMLTPYLDKGANALLLPEQEQVAQPIESNEVLQLRMLRELTFLTLEKADINLMIHTALEGISRGIGMDRVLVLMLNREKNRLTPRFVTGLQGDLLKQRFTLDVSERNNLFAQLLSQQEPLWIASLNDPKWSPLISPSLRTAVHNKGFFIAPIIVEQQSIGLFYADRADSGRALSRDDFFSFTHFVQQTNLCLAVVMKQKE